MMKVLQCGRINQFECNRVSTVYVESVVVTPSEHLVKDLQNYRALYLMLGLPQKFEKN